MTVCLVRMMYNELGFAGPVNIDNPSEFTLLDWEAVIMLNRLSCLAVFYPCRRMILGSVNPHIRSPRRHCNGSRPCPFETVLAENHRILQGRC